MGWFLTLKSVASSIGVILTALGLRLTVPILTQLLASHQSFVMSWLKPLYLFVIIHFIIISIVASSRLQNNHKQNTIDEVQMKTLPPSRDIQGEDSTYHIRPVLVVGVKVQPAEPLAAIEYQPYFTEDEDESEPEVLKNIVVGDGMVDDLVEKSPEYPSTTEKHAASRRLRHRKPTKNRRERAKTFNMSGGTGRALNLRVAKPKRNESMEDTWKAIMGKKTTSLSREGKESDTWGNTMELAPHEKYERDRFETLRKELSLSQDELNRRVEEFINKINEDMRLERQESLEQFMDMRHKGN